MKKNKNPTKKNTLPRSKRELRERSRKQYWELMQISHMNSIADETDKGNRGILYGRAIVSRDSKAKQ